MKHPYSRSSMLAGGLALALATAGAFAAAPTPSTPTDPAATNTPMQEDAQSPSKANPSTTPYSSTSASSDMKSEKISVSMQSKFDSLDVNHDGYIDKQEAAADSKLLAQFDRLDANKDSKLSLAEFANAKGLAMTTKEKSEKDRQ
jgi:hypothetical protein